MYSLNKIPVKTTNNFHINDLKIDLDVPSNLEFKKFNVENDDNIDINYSIKECFNSLIGLEMDKYLNVEMDIKDSSDKPLILNYYFNDCDVLVDNLNINYGDDVKRDIVIKYISKNDCCHFHHNKLNIIMGNNSSGNISIINLLNNNSTNLNASLIDLKDNSYLDLNVIDIGGKIKINNIKSMTGKGASSNLNNLYLGNNNDIVDMNYEYINQEINSINNIEVHGILDGKSKKKFRGTINFVKGCSGSVGKELENTILLSDTVINSSVPLMLCEEEDVIGTHAVSSGKIDNDLLFYLNTKGISNNDAKKVICMANLNKIINKLNNKELQEEITNILEKKI